MRLQAVKDLTTSEMRGMRDLISLACRRVKEQGEAAEEGKVRMLACTCSRLCS